MQNISVSIKALDHEDLEVHVAGSPAGAFVWLISVDMEHLPSTHDRRAEFHRPFLQIETRRFLDDFRRDIVIAVAATWLTLATVGRWNPERAWDDRLGRLIGALWLIFYLCAPLLALLP